MGKQQGFADAPVTVPAKFLEQIKRPPGKWQPSQFIPARGNRAKASGDGLHAFAREFVIWSHESVRPWKTGFHEAPGAMLKPAEDLLRRMAIEFESIMIAAMLEDVIIRVFEEVMN